MAKQSRRNFDNAQGAIVGTAYTALVEAGMPDLAAYTDEPTASLKAFIMFHYLNFDVERRMQADPKILEQMEIATYRMIDAAIDLEDHFLTAVLRYKENLAYAAEETRLRNLYGTAKNDS